MPLRSPPAVLLHHIRAFAADTLVCLRFFSRLPVPGFGFEPPVWDEGAFGRALRAAPLAGLVIGGIAALVLAMAIRLLGLPFVIAATLALTMQILVSGALHEDGLADVADGFGGGKTGAKKLEIMKDSRIGAYGALALILSLILRIGAVTVLLDRYGLMAAAAALPAAAAASRGFALLPLGLLAPARRDGLAHAAGLLSPLTLAIATGLGVFLGITVAFLGGIPDGRATLACAGALLASLGVTHLAFRQIGGQTGDVAGAAQQLAEIAFLLTLLVAPRLG